MLQKEVKYFDSKLIKRQVVFDLTNYPIEHKILTEIGLPNGVLDFSFDSSIVAHENQLEIGHNLNSDKIIVDLETRHVVRRGLRPVFLAKNLDNFLRQLLTYDSFWETKVKTNFLGPYRENKNHSRYASLLMKELMLIDVDLFENDNGYFWGSLVEDIESGIVG